MLKNARYVNYLCYLKVRVFTKKLALLNSVGFTSKLINTFRNQSDMLIVLPLFPLSTSAVTKPWLHTNYII